MSRYRCEVEDEAAPRVGCGCRECYRIRRDTLDPRLVELVEVGHGRLNASVVLVAPSSNIVRLGIDSYLVGQIEWASLHVEIIKALVEANDRLIAEKLEVAKRSLFGGLSRPVEGG